MRFSLKKDAFRGTRTPDLALQTKPQLPLGYGLNCDYGKHLIGFDPYYPEERKDPSSPALSRRYPPLMNFEPPGKKGEDAVLCR
jgi:hypothetical protein